MDRLGNAILVTHEKNKHMHPNLLTFPKTVHQIGEGRNLNVSSKDRKGGTVSEATQKKILQVKQFM